MSVAGKSYPPVTAVIDPGRAAGFARAIGADPAAGIPPTYAAVYALFTTAPQLFSDEEAAVDFGRLLHAEQEFEFARHPEAGEEVVATARVVSDIERRGARFVQFETAVEGEGGDAICVSRALFVVRA